MEKELKKKRSRHITFDKTIFTAMNNENEKIIDKYQVVKKLGEGGYGTVYEIENKETKDKRACKVVAKKKVGENFEKERDILLRIDNPYIVKLYEIFEDKRYYYMVMDLSPGGELFDRLIKRIRRKDMYSEIEACRIFTQLMKAINYLHGLGICHRDIKPENLLFTTDSPDSDIKLIDFGLAKDLKKEGKVLMKKKVGTCYYVAPEVLNGNYTQKCDIWSAGVILYLLLSGDPPFNGKSDHEIMSKIAVGQYDFPESRWSGISSMAKNLIKKMLCPEKDRLTAEEVLKNEWIKICESTDPMNAELKNKPININLAGLENYVESNKIKKMAFTYIADRLMEDEIDSLKDLFEKFDKDNNGTITFSEFKEGLAKFNLSEKELGRMFHLIDTDKNGVLYYTEFIAAVLNIKNNLREVYLEEAFKALDVNNDGKICKEDLMEILRIEEGDRKAESVAQIIEECDKNKDGGIDYEEFLDMILNN